jgi:hypothetical protein
MKRLYIGLGLMLVSIVLLILLFVPGYGSFYWSNPWVFLPLTLIGELGAFFGSLSVRKYIFQGLKKETYFFDALIIIGDGLVLVGLLGAASALLTGVAIAMNPMNWGKYYGTGHSYNNMILASQEMSYWVGVSCMTVGQFVIGFAFKRKLDKLRPDQIHPVKQTLKTKS